ncbi:hypothetical protein ACFDTO_08140 [Microbacteriaceae bacterium 4G12]
MKKHIAFAIAPAITAAALTFTLGAAPAQAVTEPFTVGVTQPSASNTGVGIVRAKPTTVHTSTNFTVTKDNQVVKDLIVNGIIDTNGYDDVVIENVIVKGQGANTGAPFLIKTGKSNRVTIRYSEIYSSIGYPAMGIGTGNYKSYRNNIHHVSDAHRVNLSGSAAPDAMLAVIEGNYVHDTIMWSPDPAQARADNKTHSDALVQLEGGKNIRITGNRATGLRSTDGTSSVTRTTTTYPYTPVTSGGMAYAVAISTVMVSPAGSWTISNVQIDKNWLGGGEVTINGADDLLGTSSITGNVFDANSLQNVAIWPKSPVGLSLSGNTLKTVAY